MKSNNILLFSLLLLFSSCFRLAFILRGGQKPRPFSIEEIQEKAINRGMPLQNSFMSRDEYGFTLFLERLNKSLLFDKNGFYMDYSPDFENPKCKQNVVLTIRQLDTLSYIPRDSTKKLSNEITMWHHFAVKDSVKASEFENADYYLVVYWNAFSDRSNNKERVAAITNAIQANRKAKIKLILVNQDLRYDMNDEKLIENSRKYKGIDFKIVK